MKIIKQIDKKRIKMLLTVRRFSFKFTICIREKHTGISVNKENKFEQTTIGEGTSRIKTHNRIMLAGLPYTL